jgi:hypothetical protein
MAVDLSLDENLSFISVVKVHRLPNTQNILEVVIDDVMTYQSKYLAGIGAE